MSEDELAGVEDVEQPEGYVAPVDVFREGAIVGALTTDSAGFLVYPAGSVVAPADVAEVEALMQPPEEEASDVGDTG